MLKTTTLKAQPIIKLSSSFMGLRKNLPHLLCTTNMMLIGIEVPVQVKNSNTLSKPLSRWDLEFDIIVTNPPFCGNEEDDIEKNFPSELQTRETVGLF
ncbi:MAG: type I restriction enzyme M protein [Psychromonas sp.]|jgi:type I restriction enzyme M protein